MFVCAHVAVKKEEKEEKMGLVVPFFAIKSAQRLPKVFVFQMMGSFMSNFRTCENSWIWNGSFYY